MLRPTKHLNPRSSVLNVSAMMLKVLANQRTIRYQDLYERLHKKLGEDLRPVFVPALSFLFLLGRLDYHEKTDAFEFRQLPVEKR
jgi:hypothetical protein